MDIHYYGTQDVARMLAIPVARLQRALWDGRLQRPSKSPGAKGVFLWTRDDVERASQLFRSRDAGDIFDRDLPGSVKEELSRADKLLEPVNVR